MGRSPGKKNKSSKNSNTKGFGLKITVETIDEIHVNDKGPYISSRNENGEATVLK